MTVDVQFFCLHHPDLRSRKRRMQKQFDTTIEVSVALKHREAFRRQVSREAELAVVLEDEVELPDGSPELLQGWLAEFHALDRDLLMIGTCFDIHAPETVPGKSVYCGPGFRTHCTHAYAMTLPAAEAILPRLDEIPEAFDHYLNQVIPALGLASATSSRGSSS